MKTIMLFATLFMLSSAAGAATTQLAASPTDKVYVGIGLGATVPLTDWFSSYTAGLGGNAFVGYSINENWAVQLDLDPWVVQGNSSSIDNLRVLAQAKYTFDERGFQPYLLGGLGGVYQSFDSQNTVNLDLAAGLGLQFDLARQTHLYVQAEYNVILTNSITQNDLPITAGVWVGF